MDAKSLRGIKKESESLSVVSDSLRPHGLYRGIQVKMIVHHLGHVLH